MRVVSKPHPFRQATEETFFKAGDTTLSDIVMAVQPDPALRQVANVLINGALVPIESWPLVRPKAGTLVNVVIVPQNTGGGPFGPVSGSSLTMLGLVAMPLFLPLGATLLAAGTVASLAESIYYIAAGQPKTGSDKDREGETYNLSSSRNSVDLRGPCSSLAGQFKFAPKIAAREYSELIGSDRYLRVILQLSDGPVTDPEIFIGETPIDEFDSVETELRRGYHGLVDAGSWDASTGAYPSSATFGDTFTVSTPGLVGSRAFTAGQTITFNDLYPATDAAAWDLDQGKPFKLYADDVSEEGLQVKVTNAGGPEVRTSQPNADQLSIDLLFDAGLYFLHNSPPGKMGSSGVGVTVEYSPTGADDWRPANGGYHAIYGRQRTPLFWGLRWETDGSDPNGQYDVRITRNERDFDEQKFFGAFMWVSLRTITQTSPVPIGSLAMLAMRVRASGQISGSLDEVFTRCQSIANDWDGSTWAMRPTSNPASLFRSRMQHPLWALKQSDSQINIADIEELADLCTANGWRTDAYFDGDSSLLDRLNDILAPAMSRVTAKDGLWTVITDWYKPEPVQPFTQANTFGYEGEPVHDPVPDAIRGLFWDEDNGYQPDEVTVFNDGFDADSAKLYERMTFVGITSRERVARLIRIALAKRTAQRELHRFNADIEHVVCEQGDRVFFSHDVLSNSIGAGRIEQHVESGGLVTAFVLSTDVDMVDGTAYAMLVRESDSSYLVNLLTTSGFSRTVTLETPIATASAPPVGSLFTIGVRGSEFLDLVIVSKEPGPDQSARIEAIPYNAAIYDAGDTLPQYEPGIPVSQAIQPPVVTDVISDSRAFFVTPDRRLIPQVVFRFEPSPQRDATLRIWQRISGTDAPWQAANVSAVSPNEAAVQGLDEGQTYDFRLSYSHPDRLMSRPTEIYAHEVVGRIGAPADLSGLTLGMVGGQAELRWDQPPDLDVQIGGAVVFRHSPALSGATWETSTSIGKGSVAGNQTHIVLPLKPGTYLARVLDSTGAFSDGVTTISTKQGSLFDFSQVGEALESPSFLGVKESMVVDSGQLKLGSGDVDGVLDWDSIEDFDAEGQTQVTSGVYYFDTIIDLGSVQNVRITSNLSVVIYSASDLIDLRTNPIDEWIDIDGSVGAPADAHVEYSIADEAPGSSPQWGPWLRLDSVEDSGRSIRGRLIATTEDRLYNINIISLGIKAEKVNAIT